LWDLIKGSLPASAASYLQFIRLIVEIFISTIIVLLVEVLFKALFRAKANRVLQNSIVSWIASSFYNLFGWLSSLFVNTAMWILKHLLNIRLHEKKEVFGKTDLEQFILQSKSHDNENTDELNKELFENALSLSETKIRECLIPRKEIEAIAAGTGIEVAKQKFIETRLSKLLVYEKDIDNITGYIHQLDLFKKPASISEILLPIPTIPESMSATDLMNKFSHERKTIAWVVDEFGGTSGIVTMEDLLEEIFGDINDEFDTEEFIEKQLSVNEFMFSGRLELDYIHEKYKLYFSDDDESNETLSGYIIHQNEGIPQKDDKIVIGNYQYDILHVSDTRIVTVKINILR
jgi:CBS domain containing-hemolysin-like protein